MTIFKDHLAAKGTLLCDGATGTNYFALGLETGHPPEFWNSEHPEHVLGLHGRFLGAGADIILTNSFGATSYRLKLHDAAGRAGELNHKAAELAKEAAARHHDSTGKTALVAGSMGPTGELFAPLGALDHAQARTAFAEQAEALAEGGADLLWVETMSSLEEIDAAVEAGQSTGLEVVATMTFDTAGKSMMGIAPDTYATHLRDRGVAGLGANCGIGPAELLHTLMQMQAGPGLDIPLIAKGNCGIPEYIGGAIHYHGTPDLMGRYAAFARDAGVRVIGGCCGTTPGHIAAMRVALDNTPVRAVDEVRLKAEIGHPWAEFDHTDTPDDPRDASHNRRGGQRGGRNRQRGRKRRGG